MPADGSTPPREKGTRRYDRKGEYALAVRNFSTAIELDPTNADFYHNRGFAHRKQATPHPPQPIPPCSRPW